MLPSQKCSDLLMVFSPFVGQMCKPRKQILSLNTRRKHSECNHISVFLVTTRGILEIFALAKIGLLLSLLCRIPQCNTNLAPRRCLDQAWFHLVAVSDHIRTINTPLQTWCGFGCFGLQP